MQFNCSVQPSDSKKFFIFAEKLQAMKSQAEYINLLKCNSDRLNRDYGITFMKLFGSVAKNTHNEDSDVDLFVKMPPVFYNAVAAAQYLEELLGCKVDLICDHGNMNPFFRNQIDKFLSE